MNERRAEPAGDFAAFCEVHHPRLVGVLGLFCGNRELAEELAQDTLMRAYRDWPKLRSLNSPNAWLYRVGTNLARSHFRRQSAERRARARLQARPNEAPASDTAEVIEIRQALAALPARMRAAIVLRYYGRLRIAEIAEAMDCSESLVKKLLRQALARLRQQEGMAIDVKEPIDAT